MNGEPLIVGVAPPDSEVQKDALGDAVPCHPLADTELLTEPDDKSDSDDIGVALSCALGLTDTEDDSDGEPLKDEQKDAVSPCDGVTDALKVTERLLEAHAVGAGETDADGD